MENEWVIKVNDELMHVEDLTTVEAEHWKKRSIYRVSVGVTDVIKKAYKPQVVSFGPYHHGEDHLKKMEAHKHRALLHFLKRSGKSLTFYIDSLQQVAQDLKDAYDLLDPIWQNDTDAFLQLMILDGCFMLEILRTAADDHLLIDQSQHAQQYDYAPNDPIFSNHGKLHLMPYIKRDILMLENQLPMLLLDKLLVIENQEEKMFACIGCVRKSLLWEDPGLAKTRPKKAPKVRHRSSGDEMSKTRSLKDISFRGGILKLPLDRGGRCYESMFLNLIAFERLHVGAGNEVTSYIFFMDNIIDDAKDVSLLQSSGIIRNAIGADQAVAKLFNSLSKDITLDPDSGLDLSPGHFVRDCFAIFLFALTIVRTLYGVYPYYHQRPKDNRPTSK
ncbi:unnamed protein product [Withania somnifera]